MRKTGIRRYYPPLSTEGRLVHIVPIDTIILQVSTLRCSLFTVILHNNFRFEILKAATRPKNGHRDRQALRQQCFAASSSLAITQHFATPTALTPQYWCIMQVLDANRIRNCLLAK
jgi:hypothetical protein